MFQNLFNSNRKSILNLLLVVSIFNFQFSNLNAQSVLKIGQNTGTISPSAVFETEHTTKGVLLTRMSTASIAAIVSPAKGLMVIDTSLNCVKLWDGIAWQCTGSASTTGCSPVIVNGTLGANVNLAANTTWYYSGSSITLPPGKWIVAFSAYGSNCTSLDGAFYINLSNSSSVFSGQTTNSSVLTSTTNCNTGVNNGMMFYNNATAGNVTLYMWGNAGTNTPYSPLTMVSSKLTALSPCQSKDTVVLNPTPASKCYAFEAYANAAQNHPGAGTYQKVNMNGVSFNPDGAYDATNSRFVAPEAGSYYFRGSVSLAPGTAPDNNHLATIYKNGSPYIYGNFTSPVANSTTGGASVSGLVQMNAGDSVSIRYYFAGGAGSYAYNQTGTNFGGYKIGCGQGRDTTVMPVSSFTACPAFKAVSSVSTTNNTVGSFKAIDFSGTSVDVGSAFNATTDRYTIQKKGKYIFSGYADIALASGTTQYYVLFRKNGSQYIYGNGSQMTAPIYVIGNQASVIEDCNVGDYYEFGLVLNSGTSVTASTTYSRFEGAMLNCTGAAKDTIYNYIANTCNGASITGTTTQSVATVGSTVKYNNLTTVAFTKGSITTSGSQVTIQKAGYYKVSGHMYVVNTFAGTNYMTLILSGVPGGLQSTSLVAGEGTHLNASDIVYKNVGDVISMGIFQNSAGVNLNYGELEVFQMDCGGGGKDTVVTSLGASQGFNIGSLTNAIPNTGVQTTIKTYSSIYKNDFGAAAIIDSGFKVPAGKAGWYNLTGYVACGGVSGQMDAYILLYVNNLNIGFTRDMDGATSGSRGVEVVQNYYLNDGDIVSFRMAHTGTTNPTNFSARISGVRYGGQKDTIVQQVSQLTACPAFEAKNKVATLTTIPTGVTSSNKVTVDSVFSNAASGFNASTGRFTAPKDGFYHFTAAFHTSVIGTISYSRAHFAKNGATVAHGVICYPTAAGYGTNSTISSDFKLVAGDYIELYFGANNTSGVNGSVDNVRFSGFMTNCAGDSSIASNALEPWYNVATATPATDNTQNIYQSGRVGVGTNAPSVPLHTKGTTAGLSRIQYGNSANFAEEQYADETDAIKWSTGIYGDLNAGVANRNSFYIWQYKNKNDVTVNAQRMVITDTGYMGVNVNNPNSTLHSGGSFATPITDKTAAYSATDLDHIITASGTFSITLPTAVGIAGREYIIKNRGTGTVTIATTSSQTIDGAASIALGVQWSVRTVVSDGANWYIINNQ